MDQPNEPTPLASLVDAVVVNGAMLHGILSDMEAYQASGASAPDARRAPSAADGDRRGEVADAELGDLTAAAAVQRSVSVTMETDRAAFWRSS